MALKDKTGNTSQAVPSLERGIELIRCQLATLAAMPGVYRMINAAGGVLYVGKAKNLKKRVASYTRPLRLSNRLARMVAETVAMEFVITHTEAEALLLEANLIKRLKPRYNILLRDDKSFPLILVAGGHDFPRIIKHRGQRTLPGEYFGPFASVGAVNQTLATLQRIFGLRTCSDAVFANRKRPCLLYQIKRCSGPCVGHIGDHEYTELLDQARAFLSGESRNIQLRMAKRMQLASDAMDFENAAIYRDRIRALSAVQAHQDINPAGIGDADVIAACQADGQTCIQVFFFRGGRNFGNRAYFPSHSPEDSEASVLEAFITQFYDNRTPPAKILVSHRLAAQALIGEALSVTAARRVSIINPRRGDKTKLVDHAMNNAAEALGRRQGENVSKRRLMENLADTLGLDAPPERIEVYDNSHVSGTSAVGTMIVAGPNGMIRNAYRKFNIRGNFSPGDDYAMMREVLRRRFTRVLREDPERNSAQWPDLVLIDGGKGQMKVAEEIFSELGINDVCLAAIAKGAQRRAGREKIYQPTRSGPLILDTDDPVLYFLQRLRDEAHRFAIGTHRAKRAKSMTLSVLDEIPGIGARRKKALLHHFGSARAVSEAGCADLRGVEGISGAIANKIYDWFHGQG